MFGVPYDSRFLTDDPYSGYGTFGIDPLTGRDIPNVNKVNHWGLSGTVEWKLTDTMGLKFITAYRDFSNSFGRDSDGSPLPVNPTWDTTTHTQFTEEVQLCGAAFNGKLDWTTGAFYYDADDTNAGFVTLYPYIVQMQDTRDTQNTKNWAAFVHGIYHWTDKLSTTVGVRYTDDKKDVTIYRRNFDGTVPIDNAALSFGATRTSPKVGIDYKWSDTLMTYALYSVGFRGGGFGPRPSNALQLASFQPEDLDNYEIGFKSECVRAASAVERRRVLQPLHRPADRRAGLLAVHTDARAVVPHDQCGQVAYRGRGDGDERGAGGPVVGRSLTGLHQLPADGLRRHHAAAVSSPTGIATTRTVLPSGTTASGLSTTFRWGPPVRCVRVSTGPISRASTSTTAPVSRMVTGC